MQNTPAGVRPEAPENTNVLVITTSLKTLEMSHKIILDFRNITEITNTGSLKNSHGFELLMHAEKFVITTELMQKLRESNTPLNQYTKAIKPNQYETMNSSDISYGNADSL